MNRQKKAIPKMMRQNDICCSQPPLDPNYTVCFPDQQIIPTSMTPVANPFYDVANTQSFWTYTIQIDGPNGIADLSHWNIAMCEDLLEAAVDNEDDFFIVEVSEDGGATFDNITAIIEALPGGDPSLAPPFNTVPVLKIGLEQPAGTTWIYRITIIDDNFFDLAAETGSAFIKAGSGDFIFNSANCGVNALPTPSVNCNRQLNPELTLEKTCPLLPPGRDFDVRDTVTITLTVTNTTNDDVMNVTVLDLLRVPACVIISSLTTSPLATTINPPTGPYTNTDILVTWTGLTVPANSSIELTITFTIQRILKICCFITNVDAGIGELSGTGIFTCTIPLQAPLPTRGIPWLMPDSMR